jgi:hypothetical protein
MVTAARKAQSLSALTASNIKDAPWRHVRKVNVELPSHQFLTDNLAKRAQTSSPLLLTRREFSTHVTPFDHHRIAEVRQ